MSSQIWARSRWPKASLGVWLFRLARHRALLSTFAALIVIVGASPSPRADSGLPESIVPAASTPPAMMREVHCSVLTTAPDGSWGVSIRQPITEAVANSVAMHGYYRGSKGVAACAAWKKHIEGLIREHFQADDLTESESMAFSSEAYSADVLCTFGRYAEGQVVYEAIRIDPVERPKLETHDKASPPRADSDLPEYIVPPGSTPPVVLREAPYTVLTMAPDGSWGVATSIFIREAITGAMTDCMLMSGRKLGCGYISKAGRGDWVLGVRCGSENILAASKILANAELAAFNRETELRQDGRNMPPCFRLVTVHPDGLVADTKTRVPTLTLEPTGVTRD